MSNHLDHRVFVLRMCGPFWWRTGVRPLARTLYKRYASECVAEARFSHSRTKQIGSDFSVFESAFGSEPRQTSTIARHQRPRAW